MLFINPKAVEGDTRDEEIVYADKKERRWALVLFVAAAILGAIFFKLTQSYFQGYDSLLQNDPKAATLRLVKFLKLSGVLFAALVFPFSAYTLRIGVRILRSGRFPPPGMKVIRNTKIRKGRKAKIRGIGIIAAAAVLFLTSFLVMVSGGRLVAWFEKKAKLIDTKGGEGVVRK